MCTKKRQSFLRQKISRIKNNFLTLQYQIICEIGDVTEGIKWEKTYILKFTCLSKL